MKRLIALISLMTFVLILAGCEGNQSVGQSQSPSQSTPKIKTVAVTRDSKDCVGKDYQELERELCDAGFLSVNIEAIDDLTSSETNRAGVVESISINGSADFVQGQEFDEKSTVVIRYHDYRNCTVKVYVDFVSNLLFNKYDVNFLANEITEGTMEHGTDAEFELRVKAGTHNLSFVSDESSSVKGSTKIVIDGDMKLHYQISCYKDEVAVKVLSTEVLECSTSEHAWLDATCVKPKTCTVCKKTEGEAAGHEWIEATCVVAKNCSVCHVISGNPLGHNVSDWTILQSENCGKEGIKEGLCTICSEKVTKTVPKTGAHTYSEWEVTSKPSCSVEGTQTRVCQTCQHEDTSKIAKLSHDYNDWEVTSKPSCTVEGTQTRVCKTCQQKDNAKIEMLSHDYVESVIVEATYYDAGTKGQKCSSCGAEGDTTKYYTYYKTSLKEIFNAYKANEIAADEKYDDMYIEFSAKISEIKQGGLFFYGDIVFEVSNGTYFNDEVKCAIKSNDQLEYVKTLVVGNKVTIKGKITAVSYDKDFGSNMYIDIMEIE